MPVEHTVHTNPDWMMDLKKNFHLEIANSCSARTRAAVENNEDIEVKVKLCLFNAFIYSD